MRAPRGAPAWHHHTLPNPLGDRDEPGPLWITDPTLRLLLRCASPAYGRLCEEPHILESWTAVATENLLERLRGALRDARATAIAGGDDVTLDYVKQMYAKLVTTMGGSNYNREINRPDWMHTIRSQAFSNLWVKAFKAHQGGLAVVRVMGTDELLLTGGDWAHRVHRGPRRRRRQDQGHLHPPDQGQVMHHTHPRPASPERT